MLSTVDATTTSPLGIFTGYGIFRRHCSFDHCLSIMMQNLVPKLISSNTLIVQNVLGVNCGVSLPLKLIPLGVSVHMTLCIHAELNFPFHFSTLPRLH